MIFFYLAVDFLFFFFSEHVYPLLLVNVFLLVTGKLCIPEKTQDKGKTMLFFSILNIEETHTICYVIQRNTNREKSKSCISVVEK